MTRLLYGASSAEFAFTLGAGTPAPVLVAAGASLTIYTSINGTPINDLLSTTDNVFTPGAAATSVTSRPDGTLPFFAPDGTAGTLAAKTVVGGVDHWTLLNPSTLADLVVANTTSIATNASALTGQASNISTLGGRVTALEGVGTTAPAWTSITGKPLQFNPTLHSHLQTDLTVAADVHAMLAAPNNAAIVAAIGAKPASFTGLQIGATSTTAMPGDRVFDVSEITGASAAIAGKVSNLGGVAGLIIIPAGTALPTTGIVNGAIYFQPTS